MANEADAVEALRDAIAIRATVALVRLQTPRLRGPFPYPTESDLARAGSLRAVANWLRAAAKRSKGTLGRRGVADALDATSDLAHLADLLAAVEDAPTPDVAASLAASTLAALAANG